MSRQEWAGYRKARKKDLQNLIKRKTSYLQRCEADVKQYKLAIKRYNEELKTVDEKCDRALDNHYSLVEENKEMLNGNVAKAILDRKVAHVVGLLSGLTSVEYTPGRLKVTNKYYCDKWFCELLAKVDRSTSDRQEMYKQLESLATAQSQEEINDHLGMYLLKVS